VERGKGIPKAREVKQKKKQNKIKMAEQNTTISRFGIGSSSKEPQI
jgi:hypothetical protein